MRPTALRGTFPEKAGALVGAGPTPRQGITSLRVRIHL